MKNYLQIFGERLKELRKEAKLSTTSLGDKIGVSAMSISRWERSVEVPTMSNVIAIALYFKVSLDYLCGLED